MTSGQIKKGVLIDADGRGDATNHEVKQCIKVYFTQENYIILLLKRFVW